MTYRVDGHAVSKAWHTVLTHARRHHVKFKVNDGRRTLRMQLARIRKHGLWSQANPTGAAPAVPWAPHINYGRANHAIDVDQFAGDGAAGLVDFLHRHGCPSVCRPIATEPWHIQIDRGELLAYARKIERSRLRARAERARARVTLAVQGKPRSRPGVHGISNRGLALIAGFEGFSAKPYRDPVGVWTIGYGETKGVGPNSRHVTRSQALAQLRRRVNRDYLQPVLVVANTQAHLVLTQPQADALASFAYNLGLGPLQAGRTMGDALRSRNRRRIADAFLVYDRAGNPPHPLPGLTRRRRAERRLFLK